MKASEFIGTMVINKQVKEVGKVAELSITLKKCLVDQVIIRSGSALKKTFFSVSSKEIAEIGDFMQLNLDDEDIKGKESSDKIEKLVKEGSLLKDFLGIKVLSADAMDVGTVADMIIDPKGCLIHNVLISTGSTFQKKELMISDENIEHIGDYVVLNINKDRINYLLNEEK
jgi:sporulation protein YlmC with PRC-barrel domain